jgi:hypothetical protein
MLSVQIVRTGEEIGGEEGKRRAGYPRCVREGGLGELQTNQFSHSFSLHVCGQCLIMKVAHALVVCLDDK